MKILGAKVSMFLDKAGQRYANAPDLDILVEHVPHDVELKWNFTKGKNGDGIFWAEEDGFYRTYFHNGDELNHGGLGGAACVLPMVDGSEKIIRGPWCGNPRAAKEEFGLPVLMDVTLFEGFERCGMANWWVTPEVARQCLKLVRFFNEAGERRELPYRAVLVADNQDIGLLDIAIVKNTQHTPDILRAEYLNG